MENLIKMDDLGPYTLSPTIIEVENDPTWFRNLILETSHFPNFHDCGRQGIEYIGAPYIGVS